MPTAQRDTAVVNLIDFGNQVIKGKVCEGWK